MIRTQQYLQLNTGVKEIQQLNPRHALSKFIEDPIEKGKNVHCWQWINLIKRIGRTTLFEVR